MKNRKIISIITLLLIISSIGNNLLAQSYRTTNRKSYTTSKTKTPTYDAGGTKYFSGETYKTTGQPKVDRSSSARHEFLKGLGKSKVPAGYQVDHIVPLSQGGKDIPSNMQLITVEQHKQKTTREKHQVSSTYNKPYNFSTPKSTKASYKTPSYKYSTSKSSYSTRSYSGGGRRK